MRECWDNFRNRARCCDCTLKTFGYIYGWLGVILRGVGTIFVATIISQITEHDPSIYAVVLITAISYIQLSLATNLFFIIGIYKEKPYFMLPYVVIGGLEIFISMVAIIGISIILQRAGWGYYLWWFIPLMVVEAVAYFFFWIKSIKLFKNMEIEITRKREDNERIASLRQSFVDHF